MRTHPTNSHSRRPQAAFTLIEVALSVAIAAFALVAIIGVMPAGLNVQRENREESIINNDAKFLIDAIRSGSPNPAQSVNSAILGQRVLGVVVFSNNVPLPLSISNPQTNPVPPDVAIGMLSTPGTNVINYAWVRGLSGSLGDIAGTNDLVFSYIVTTQIQPHDPTASPLAAYQSTNLYDLRMTFQWPLYPNNTVGNGRQSYRVIIAGGLVNNSGLYYFTPTHFQSP